MTQPAGAATMWAVVTTGHGGHDRLDYREVPVPVAGPGEVLLRVLAAGVNATDVNTRLGWCSASVTAGTDRDAEGAHEKAGREDAAGTRPRRSRSSRAPTAAGGWWPSVPAAGRGHRAELPGAGEHL
jgi:hypothetical protein